MKEVPRISKKSQREQSYLTHSIDAFELTQQEKTKGEKAWTFVNSPLYDFSESFQEVLGKDSLDLKDDIEKTLASKNNRIALELGGTGSPLFSEFTPEFFERTAGINLTDYRTDEAKHKDIPRRHSVIEGDMLSSKTHEAVEKWLGGKKVDVLIERMYGGSNFFPEEPFFMSKQANFYYKLLAEDGLLYAQVPRAFYKYLPTWKEHIKEQYADTLDVKIWKPYLTFLRLQKRKGAPEDLPLLTAREVLRFR